MRIEQLEYLIAVVRHGSFRQAAKELHMSQPALSQTIGKLEQELGVELIDRRREGATISEGGRELLPHILTAVEVIDRLRVTADNHRQASTRIRLGTVTAATAPLLTPTIEEFRRAHPECQIEVVTTQQSEIHRHLIEGGLDLGLVNYLAGDDIAPEFDSSELLRGRPVVCLRGDDRLAARDSIPANLLRETPLIMMRSGYVMHRFVHRIFEGAPPQFACIADGADMGKTMVAAGLGVTVLPSYSVVGDPLEQGGEITWREIEGHDAEVFLAIQRRHGAAEPASVRRLRDLFVSRGAALSAPAGATARSA